jgi:hypothetical protein
MIHPLFGTVLVEFKEGDYQLQPAQRTVATDIIRAGGRFVVCRLLHASDGEFLRFELGNRIGAVYPLLKFPEGLAAFLVEAYSGDV